MGRGLLSDASRNGGGTVIGGAIEQLYHIADVGFVGELFGHLRRVGDQIAKMIGKLGE